MGTISQPGWWAAVILAFAGVVLALALAPVYALLSLPLIIAVSLRLLAPTPLPPHAGKPTAKPAYPPPDFPPPEAMDPAPATDPVIEHRLRGIALQGQGQLDAAFDAFRQCPLDDSMLDVVYNLALEYERRRQFDRAAAVLHHLRGGRPGYRDVEQRIRRAELMVETSGTAAAVKAPGERMMLGRYEVQRELGKGAMGVVYLGRDPQIGRVVAIKTVALSQEFDSEELAEVKERFFREAETAGRLAHPHIVTIYDAGDSDGLAFIAMELLRGHDLTRNVKPDTLLPVTSVIELGAQAADALDYAHAQGVIHRDIKPANLVYERARRTVKITDFGIARITDSSRTRTGMVLGTPSYMSPEQLTGKAFDGRSDIFSLAVTLYQLLTGQLPFRADSMATLVQRISLEEPMPASELRPDLPVEIDAILARAMNKDPDKRYQRADDFARALRGLHTEEGDLWV
ncbi:MAG: serine/threonine protein kinase [Xanthomonadaceae bacterium]|nr:serine/threonine protein kinase [Xanthomonadaceae bacterium]